jgi:protein-S-isoprenylcysteine O-methyltransferase Ste14
MSAFLCCDVERSVMRVQTPTIVYLARLIAYVAIRGVFGERTKRTEKVVRRVNVRDRALVGGVFVGTFLLPLLYVFSSWLRWADYSLPPVVQWSGVFVMLFALWLFWRAHVDLGLNWSITLELRKDHELITHGVYRCVRHPMYSAIFLFAIAQGMLLPNWLAGWSGLVSFALLYLSRVRSEEEMMSEAFGTEYEDYVQRTRRLWPS